MTKFIYLFLILCVPHLTNSPDTVDKEKPENEAAAFGIELYKTLETKDQNTFISPISVSSLLAMCYAGADGETAGEISKALHFSGDQTRINRNFRLLLADIKQRNKEDIVISIANGLWVQDGFELKRDYVSTLKKNYNADVDELDFVNETEKSCEKINRWVAKETNDKIMELLNPQSVSKATKLILANAIYFYGQWKFPFDEDRTREDFFYVNGTSKQKKSFMNAEERFSYAENDLLQIVELPYSAGNISMYVLLPKEKTGISDIEQKLSLVNLNQWIEQMKKEKVRLSLPKFKLTNEFDLTKTLKQMGISAAFSTNADFSGINGKKNLKIDKVIHKTYIEVNEKGTEAAGATAGVIVATSVPSYKTFRANRPFIFLIKDQLSDNIFFIGKIVNPQSQD